MTREADHLVLAYRCDDYRRDAVEAVVAEGMTQLGYHPSGRVFVKPNVVFAGDPEVFGRHAYTEPTFVGATVGVLANQPGMDRVDIGEKSAVGFPTRYC